MFIIKAMELHILIDMHGAVNKLVTYSPTNKHIAGIINSEERTEKRNSSSRTNNHKQAVLDL